MAKREKNKLRPLSQQDQKLQAIYAKSRREFSAADLQKFTRIEEGICLEEVIAEMEEIQRNHRPRKA